MQTILIYSPQTSNRLAYTASALFGNAGFGITENQEELANHDGPKINYSKLELKNSLQILPDGLLNETGISSIDPIFTSHRTPKLFLTKQQEYFKNNIIDFDIFSAVFYVLSRYEEYHIYQPDQHDRFCGKSSIASKYDIQQKPIVDIWRQLLYNTLEEIYTGFEIPIVTFSTLATIDIDRLYLYKEKSVLKSLGGLFKDIIQGKFKCVAKRLNVLMGKDLDPHDNLIKTIEYYRNKKIPLHIFWLLGDTSVYDNNIPHTHIEQQKTIVKSSKYAEIGIHPSYNSYHNIEQIKTEKQRLETILKTPVTTSRQHFLRLRLPQTYQQLLQAGITHDYSMGWHDIIGFRAGTAHTFNWYDIENECETNLKITPFVAMDVTLKNYMGLDITQATIILNDLQTEIKKYGGTFSTIAHNESLSGWGEWEGWDASIATGLNPWQ